MNRLNHFIALIFSLLCLNTLIAQEETDYTKWSFNIRGNYLTQENVGINTSSSSFDFKNTFAVSGGFSYQIIDKNSFNVWAGIDVLHFAPKVNNFVTSNGVEHDLGIPPPRDYENVVVRVPFTYKGKLLESIGLSEFAQISYNIPGYRFETIISYVVDNELLYQTIATADENYLSAAIGVEKAIYTYPLLLELGVGYSLDLNEFYDGNVRLGDETSSDYTLGSDGLFLNLSIRPRKFKLSKK